jgi:carbon monoxide dehydrogenase subunit G
MLLQNEIDVALGLDATWDLLTDLERIAPCLPGATLEGRDGDRYRGSVKVKVGPISAHFTGTAEFVEKDRAGRCAVIAASGRDPRGQSNATAEVRARLEPVGTGETRVLIDTQLDISGRVAQFGRGAIADVSNRLLAQFVANLAEDLVPTHRTAVTSPTTTPGARHDRGPAESSAGDLNLLAMVVPTLKERYGQALLGAALGTILSWLLFGRRSTR